jgi:hypothetical protein
LDGASICCVPRAPLKLFGDLAFAQFSTSPVFINNLAVRVILVLFEDVRAGRPTHTTAYASVTIYGYFHFAISHLNHLFDMIHRVTMRYIIPPSNENVVHFFLFKTLNIDRILIYLQFYSIFSLCAPIGFLTLEKSVQMNR